MTKDSDGELGLIKEDTEVKIAGSQHHEMFPYQISPGISIVSGAFSSLAGALITTGKIEPTSAITLIGPGIVFSDWIAKFAIA
ncbi:20106_t:CDS:2 [Funneliformis geosporum]|nr:20106_t:CDS:2 [Funneliformis geosporum]